LIDSPKVGNFFFWFFIVVTVVWTLVAVVGRIYKMFRKAKGL
jgi:dolichyl-phosphate-mannose--protein O-mannosyl transferase